jgi:hypothetical protein
MGSALALREVTPLVRGTPKDEKELVKELSDVTTSLRLRERLEGWTSAIRVLRRRNITGFKWLLLVLDVHDHTIKVHGYANRQEATKAIGEIEQSKRPELDAVLVWVQSISSLKAAYPNYYADTREFISALDSALRRPSRV